MDDKDQNTTSEVDTPEAEQPSIFVATIKGIICGAVAALLIAFMVVEIGSTGMMKIPDTDMVLEMLDGVCTKNQSDLIEHSFDNNCMAVEKSVSFTYYDVIVYEAGYKGNEDRVLATIGFHWSHTKNDFELDEFKWYAACPCGCGCDICTVGGYEE